MTLFIAAYFLLGLLVGFMAGLLGVGGGAIMVPVFTMLFVLQGVATPENVMHLSLGTSMATIFFTSFASLRAHHKKQNIQTDVAVKIAVGVLVGTFAATFVASYAKGIYLALFFSVFMIFVAVKMFRKQAYLHNPVPHGTVGNVFSGALTAPLGVKYVTTLPVNTLKKIFGVLAVILSIKMLSSVL